MRDKIALFVMLFLVLGLSSCSRMARQFPSFPVRADQATDQLRAAQEAYKLAEQTKTRGDQMAVTKKGIGYSERCLELAPKQAACHFYLALNLGLHYEAKIIGYSGGLQRIVTAAEQVIKLDPQYDNGGGYRLLGRLYFEVPSFGKGITRDYDKSIQYLEQAVKIAPDYPENHLFLAETLLVNGNKNQARQHLAFTAQLLKQQSFNKKDFKTWHKKLVQLQKK